MTKKLTARQLAAQVSMLSPEEVALLQRCVKMLRPDLIAVNIGANVGTSALAILEAAPGAFVFSVDKRPCPEERQNLVRAGLPANRVVRVLGDSARIGTHWPYRVDLLLVDGGHSDEQVRADIGAWLPKLVSFDNGGKQERAIVLFHDYQHPNLPGLSPIVDKAMQGRKRIGQARYLVAFEV